ncbi:SDR family oxidoreductase [Streptomyces sp. MBT56]|uniref:oxidoreductase n=1 Tax=unclassified Streptomyces TaxID=2593676 RepID=UPI00190A5D4D|nr:MULTISPECIES: oxidoreductase [unclassified Streptomyces]MBK3556834.1 SDR family oxidoreductase [Streptomyces sp. MBT56]MBK3602071.1 SDR family oxidoreductase [Streptomyces sp. MBT54]MBK3613460.1 SDR family oxidoreductase [Streptomyces sp. MBT98]MBK6042912.1 SDR family oxidoreductase [Streptomyces sp. MBT55]
MRTRRRWSAADVPDRTGTTAVVTGASSGIGLHLAQELARHGAHVVLAVRDPDRGVAAAARIQSRVPSAQLTVRRLDLSRLASVRAGAEELRDRFPRIHLLINNAGVMWTDRARTPDGHELQFATNHLGHFALTGLLLDSLRAAPGARVVTISSYLHRLGRIDFRDLHGERRYSRYRAYNQSKLANLMFALELHHRLAESGAELASLAAHPGLTATDLGRDFPAPVRRLGSPLAPLFLQPAAAGMLPGLRAATDPGARGGEFYGPLGVTETRGAPGLVRPGRAAVDPGARRRLWEESEHLTGVRLRP